MSGLNQPLSPLSPTNETTNPFHEIGSSGAGARAGMNGNGVPVPATHNRTSSAPFPAMQREYNASGTFAGPRSPPKAKSELVPYMETMHFLTLPDQTPLMFLASSIPTAHARLAPPANSPMIWIP